MDPVTKHDLVEMEERLGTRLEKRMGEMGGEIVEVLDVSMEKKFTVLRKDIKRDMMDLRGDMLAETKRQVDQHVVTHHA